MSRIQTFLTGRNLPTIWQPGTDAPSIANEKTIRDFTRVVEQTRILERERAARQFRDIKAEIELDRLLRIDEHEVPRTPLCVIRPGVG